MRQFEYTLTFTMPTTPEAGRSNQAVQMREALSIADIDQGFVRHFSVPAHSARLAPSPEDARWTCEEERISLSPA